MHDSKAELLLVRKVGTVPCNKFVEEGDVPSLIPRFDISSLCLNRGDFGERLDLAREVVTAGAKVAQADLMWVNGAEGSERLRSGEPAEKWPFRLAQGLSGMRIDAPFTTILGRYFRHPSIGKDTAVQELHDIEGCSNDRVVLAEDDGFGNRYLALRSG